jgi:integrase
MRSFLKFCQIQDISIDNPQKLLYQRPIKREARFLQPMEITKILHYVEKNLKHKAIILLLLTTGLRLSELCSLTKKQLQNAVMIGNVYQINVIGKGKKLRSIFLPVVTWGICRKLKMANTPYLLGFKK